MGYDEMVKSLHQKWPEMILFTYNNISFTVISPQVCSCQDRVACVKCEFNKRGVPFSRAVNTEGTDAWAKACEHPTITSMRLLIISLEIYSSSFF